jgi:L-alanine-DL-glutamate epimerase-like enolase superfamily enzyme
MKISRIDLYTTALPYSGGVYRLSAGRTYESFDASIIRITCDDGTEGWGESTPFGSTYIAAHSLGGTRRHRRAGAGPAGTGPPSDGPDR